MEKNKAYLEARSFPFEVTEVRKTDGEPTRIEGYAAVFNKLSSDLGGFKEKIEPGFFSDVLGDDVRALFNHDDNMVLGRTKNDTLTLEEDNKGLPFVIFPPDTTYARDLITLMDRGDVNQMSFQWITKEDGDSWDESNPKKIVRTLLRGGCKSLWDVSPVTFPAYPQTKAGVRSAKQTLIDHLEELLEHNSKEKEQDKKDQGYITVLERKLILLQKEY